MTNTISAYTLEGLTQLLAQMHQPKFRAKQVFHWLYASAVESYDQMTNVPQAVRTQLADAAPMDVPTVVDKQVSADGTRKYVLRFADGARVETVGIPSHDCDEGGKPRRLTVCFSTQVGCPMACAFCATGTEGFTRNLLPGEMAQQLLAVSRDMDMRITNAVAMGQGEPFLNYRNTVDALHILNHPDALNIGARHITVSTCGILDGVRQFGQEKEQFVLALSLHAARQDVRNEIMPGCHGVSLKALKSALVDYEASSGRRVSLEYLMIDGLNDSEQDLAALVSFCKNIKTHVNLLPVNSVDGSPYRPCSAKRMNSWVDRLSRQGIETNIRTSRGSDIAGACGQLKNKTALTLR